MCCAAWQHVWLVPGGTGVGLGCVVVVVLLCGMPAVVFFFHSIPPSCCQLWGDCIGAGWLAAECQQSHQPGGSSTSLDRQHWIVLPGTKECHIVL